MFWVCLMAGLPAFEESGGLSETAESYHAGDGLYHLKKNPLKRCPPLWGYHRRL